MRGVSICRLLCFLTLKRWSNSWTKSVFLYTLWWKFSEPRGIIWEKSNKFENVRFFICFAMLLQFFFIVARVQMSSEIYSKVRNFVLKFPSCENKVTLEVRLCEISLDRVVLSCFLTTRRKISIFFFRPILLHLDTKVILTHLPNVSCFWMYVFTLNNFIHICKASTLSCLPPQKKTLLNFSSRFSCESHIKI